MQSKSTNQNSSTKIIKVSYPQTSGVMYGDPIIVVVDVEVWESE